MPMHCKHPNLPSTFERITHLFLSFPSKGLAISKGQSFCCLAPALSDSTSTELASTLDKGTDAWDTMRQGVPSLHKYAEDLFDTAAKTSNDVAARVKIIRALLQTVKDDITEFRKSFRVPSPAHGGSLVNARSEGQSLSQVSIDIDGAFEEILKRVHEAFPAPDTAAHHDARQRLIKHILEEAEIELIKILCVKHHLVAEDALRKFWRGVSPIIEGVVVTTADLAEQHPKLTAFVIVGVISMLIPESWFTKPLLRLIGFGPVGPVKGEHAFVHLCLLCW